MSLQEENVKLRAQVKELALMYALPAVIHAGLNSDQAWEFVNGKWGDFTITDKPKSHEQ